LTVSRSAGPSGSAPEEFTVEPHRSEGNEPDTSPSITLHPTSGETNASALPEEPPLEPGEDVASELTTKPLPKVNAVAHEVQVRATGARPGNLASERELFTEPATTVLVFEKGAVIRLAAAVTPGQLLFLTNEKSKREVVAQVMRKRTFRPTECYVELEFTEPAPGFWGMEFSAATALLPKDAAQLAAAELVASAETTADELGEPAPPPSAEEVLALKKDVDALRSQLKLLQTQPTAEPGVPGTAISDSSSPFVTSVPRVDAPSAASELTPSVATTVKSPSIGSEPQLAPMTAAHQEFLPPPAMDFRASLPKRKRSFRARGNFTPGFRAGALRLVVLVVALLATMIGAAWYKHWLPGMHESKKISVASWAGGVTTIRPVPAVQAPVPGASQAQTGNSELGKDAPASSDAVSKTPATSEETESQIAANNDLGGDSSLSRDIPSQRVTRGKPTPSASRADRSSVHAPAVTWADSAPSSVEDSVVVPPKLIRSVRAAASLEDLRDFETGSVLIDAVIDTEGDVKSINVLSGPPSLRRPALEALKSYKYEPATRNGKPVPAHVTIRIQFHFE
jgi:periplasmic protein TonB